MGSDDAQVKPGVFAVNLGLQAVAASTAYVLVDLSDVTNFPHSLANWLDLLALELNAEKASDGVFDIWIGVVLENDGTDGSVQWIHVWHLEANGNPTDSTDRFVDCVDFAHGGMTPDGIICKVVSSAMPFFAGNQVDADNVLWQNDVNLTSPVGATTKPGAGDVVVWVEEVSGTGTIDFSVSAWYKEH